MYSDRDLGFSNCSAFKVEDNTGQVKGKKKQVSAKSNSSGQVLNEWRERQVPGRRKKN